MEDLLKIYEKSEKYNDELERFKNESLLKLREILWGAATVAPAVLVAAESEVPDASPQQTKKRVKRLAPLPEDDTEVEQISPRKSTRASNSKLLATAAALCDEKEESANIVVPTAAPRSLQSEKRMTEQLQIEDTINASLSLMPPPPTPFTASASAKDDHSFQRPQRAAKLKSEKNLKEPSLTQKMRRPSNMDVKIKQENEQRPSQVHRDVDTIVAAVSRSTTASITSNEDSILIVAGKTASIVEIFSEDEQDSAKDKETKKLLEKTEENSGRPFRIKVKREKVSIGNEDQRPLQDATAESTFAVQTVPMPIEASMKTEHASDESTMASTILSATTSTVAPTKKGRKQKQKHKPIKVERFSDIAVNPSPISSRTRKGSVCRSSNPPEDSQRAGSIYEDAIEDLPGIPAELDANDNTETPPTRRSKVPPAVAVAAGMNETVNVSGGGALPNATVVLGAAPDATFCTNPAQTTFQVAPEQATFILDNPNATVTLGKQSGGDVDATFNVPVKSQHSLSSSRNSMETAKDTSHPGIDSLITEDESFTHQMPIPATKAPVALKGPSSHKAYKMPKRTQELFNPLVQSPVKKKVEAFENAVHAATELTKTGRPKRTKENNATPTLPSLTTPVIGKLYGPALGRFLTPTQLSNIAPSALAQPKKAPNSASKAIHIKPSSSTTPNASNLKSTNSCSSKTLSRENSGDDFRKGLHQIAEERKKQREQKHLLAAQQREAKERERAERMAKLAKEREEKRIKKQMESDLKKRELEEIHRKLRLQEESVAAAEAAKYKAAKQKAAMDQERELLMQMKSSGSAKNSRMMPPPPKQLQSKYTFEMLHEDDSTDDESKTSYKRPPPPTWSRSHVRGPAIQMEQYCPTDIIDSFFSVQPMTPDLKLIFPNIDARQLKRNSSVLWSTPPRYSELPKY